ncbi:hypothetical protein ACS0TY_023893 [Phlomoides rotata]
MLELEAMGLKFTWINKRSGRGRIWEKLDRFVANEEWFKLFPMAKASNLDFFGSDHRVIKIYLHKACSITEVKGNKHFMFENKRMMEDGFTQAVREAWNNGHKNYSLPLKIKECGAQLQAWANKNVGNIAKRIKRVSRQLEERLKNEYEEVDQTEVRRLEVELEKLYSQEEMHWQRSRDNWLTLGDRNTSFFHHCASGRQARNRIKGILDERGNWTER